MVLNPPKSIAYCPSIPLSILQNTVTFAMHFLQQMYNILNELHSQHCDYYISYTTEVEMGV